MSNIRKSDVKNHLSPRFRKKIFLSRSDIPLDAATSTYKEQPVGAESKANDSMEGAFSLSSTSERRPVASTTPKA